MENESYYDSVISGISYDGETIAEKKEIPYLPKSCDTNYGETYESFGTNIYCDDKNA